MIASTYTSIPFCSIPYENNEIENFSMNFIDLKALNDCYTKTTYLIELKLTGSIDPVDEDLYTNFQSILNLWKILIIFNFKVHRGLL